MSNLARSPCSTVQQFVIISSLVLFINVFYVAVVISGHRRSNGRNEMNWKGCKRKRSWFSSHPVSSWNWSDWGNLLFAPQETITPSVYACLVRCGRLLAVRGTTGLLLVGATDSFSNKLRLQTSSTSSRM